MINTTIERYSMTDVFAWPDGRARDRRNFMAAQVRHLQTHTYSSSVLYQWKRSSNSTGVHEIRSKQHSIAIIVPDCPLETELIERRCKRNSWLCVIHASRVSRNARFAGKGGHGRKTITNPLQV